MTSQDDVHLLVNQSATPPTPLTTPTTTTNEQQPNNTSNTSTPTTTITTSLQRAPIAIEIPVKQLPLAHDWNIATPPNDHHQVATPATAPHHYHTPHQQQHNDVILVDGPVKWKMVDAIEAKGTNEYGTFSRPIGPIEWCPYQKRNTIAGHGHNMVGARYICHGKRNGGHRWCDIGTIHFHEIICEIEFYVLGRPMSFGITTSEAGLVPHGCLVTLDNFIFVRILLAFLKPNESSDTYYYLLNDKTILAHKVSLSLSTDMSVYLTSGMICE
jgi:hypothetical protein